MEDVTVHANVSSPGTGTSDIITNSFAGVTSIKENVSVINADNAYSKNQIWPIAEYPGECVKFTEGTSLDTDSPGFNNGGNY